jgi:hypothetical protein
MALAQPLGISTPKTAAQLPFPMYVNGNEISAIGGTATSHAIRDGGFSGNSELSFTIEDRGIKICPWIAKQQRVLWMNSALDRPMFQGFISALAIRPLGPWPEIDVTVTHISSVIDTAVPVTSWDSGAHGPSDQAMLQSLFANFCQEPNVGVGGFVQKLDANVAASLPADRTTIRNAADQILAATGVLGAVGYIDDFGHYHNMAIGDLNAPYIISDAPNYSTSVPAADLTLNDDGGPDIDALMVNGANGPIPVYIWQCRAATPRYPLRWSTLDAPQAVDTPTAIAAATVEFQRRQNMVSVNLVVTGYDGWAKGQLIRITNAVQGWTTKQFTISSVNMATLSGTGIRRWTITAGSDPVLFTARLKAMHAQFRNQALIAGKLRGKLGSL